MKRQRERERGNTRAGVEVELTGMVVKGGGGKSSRKQIANRKKTRPRQQTSVRE